MATFETFSKRRKKALLGGKPDVFKYDDIPPAFRVQVIHIWRRALGASIVTMSMGGNRRSESHEFWVLIHDTMAEESGVFTLGDDYDAVERRCASFLLRAETEGALDIIELSFRVIDKCARRLDGYARSGAGIEQLPDEAIEDLNARFLEHGLGYEFRDGQLIRIDSQLLHAEAVKPALSLLNEAGFDGAEEEFLKAFDHYRAGRDKEAVAEALKAFESTMKAICAARGWSYGPKDTAKGLLDKIFANGLIPLELQSHLSAVRAALESGLPTISNRTSRHGQGATPIPLPDYLVPYALHLAAANIVLLVRAHKAMP